MLRNLFIFCLIIINSLAHAESLEVESDISINDFISANLLLSEDPEVRNAGLRAIEATGADNFLIYDLVAEQLSNHLDQPHYTIDSHSWYFKALAKSRSKRYYSVINGSFNEAKESFKLGKFYNRAIKVLKNDGQSYSPGNLDVTPLKTAIANATKKTNNLSQLGSLLDTKHCDTPTKIVNRFGFPDIMETSKTLNRVNAHFIRVRFTSADVVFNYNNFAKVILTRDGENWCYLKAFPHRPAPPAGINVEFGDNQTIDRIRQFAWVGDANTLLQLTRVILRDPNLLKNDAALDELMLRVWIGRNETDEYALNPLVHFAKQIWLSKNPRYFTAMQRLSENTEISHFQKITKRYFEEVPAAVGSQLSLSNDTFEKPINWKLNPPNSLEERLLALPSEEKAALWEVFSDISETKVLALRKLSALTPHSISVDIVAELYHQHLSQKHFDIALHKNFLAILCASNSNRYRSLSLQGIKKTRENSIKKWKENVEVQMVFPDTSFEPGSIDLEWVTTALSSL